MAAIALHATGELEHFDSAELMQLAANRPTAQPRFAYASLVAARTAAPAEVAPLLRSALLFAPDALSDIIRLRLFQTEVSLAHFEAAHLAIAPVHDVHSYVRFAPNTQPSDVDVNDVSDNTADAEVPGVETSAAPIRSPPSPSMPLRLHRLRSLPTLHREHFWRSSLPTLPRYSVPGTTPRNSDAGSPAMTTLRSLVPRLFGRLGNAQSEFATAAGLAPDHQFLEQVAGSQSLFVWYDIGNLEFLYITRLPPEQAARMPLLALRDKFEERQAWGVTFCIRNSQDVANSTPAAPNDGGENPRPRTVAFAVRGDLLLLATRGSDRRRAPLLQLATLLDRGAASIPVPSARATSRPSSPGT